MRRLPIIAAALIALLAAAPVWAEESSPSPSRPGATSSKNGFDPSENVKALSEAANKRQDDLRASSERLIHAELQAAEKLNSLRYETLQSLAHADLRRIDSEAKLRAEYSERLAVAEAKRIDAIRAVDVNAVAVANERSNTTATSLANQVSQSAEVLRAAGQRSTEEVRTIISNNAAEVSKRLTTVEQSLSEGRGKAGFQDPAITALLAKVDMLTQQKSATSGQGDMLGWIVLGLGLVIGAAGLYMRRPVPAAYEQPAARRVPASRR